MTLVRTLMTDDPISTAVCLYCLPCATRYNPCLRSIASLHMVRWLLLVISVLLCRHALAAVTAAFKVSVVTVARAAADLLTHGALRLEVPMDEVSTMACCCCCSCCPVTCCTPSSGAMHAHSMGNLHVTQQLAHPKTGIGTWCISCCALFRHGRVHASHPHTRTSPTYGTHSQNHAHSTYIFTHTPTFPFPPHRPISPHCDPFYTPRAGRHVVRRVPPVRHAHPAGGGSGRGWGAARVLRGAAAAPPGPHTGTGQLSCNSSQQP